MRGGSGPQGTFGQGLRRSLNLTSQGVGLFTTGARLGPLCRRRDSGCSGTTGARIRAKAFRDMWCSETIGWRVEPTEKVR